MTSASPSGRRKREDVSNTISGGAQHGPVLMGREFRLTVPRPEPAGRPVSLAPRPALLTGREELLADLHARLTARSGPWPRIVALHGLPGVGKTSLAVEYAHRHQAAVSVAWQFAAEDPATIADGFARLAALLGAAGGALDPRDPVASVHAVLAGSPLPWLLLFDNAPDAASVQEYLPPAGRGQVLLTTQHGLWPETRGLEVPLLESDVAASFLVNRAGDPDRQTAADLAVDLGGLPLALEQAAAYIQATGGSLAGYLDLFRQRRSDLLARGEPTGYRGTVATALTLALSRLEQTTPTAARLLRLLACLAAEPVPLSLLLVPPGSAGIMENLAAPLVGPPLGDPVTLGDAIAALRRYSLITLAGHGMVLMHRLVQAAVLDRMGADLAEEWRQAAAELIEAAVPDNTDPPQNWSECTALLPHALVALPLESDGMARIANYLGESGSYSAARDLQRQVADARDRLRGADHPATLDAKSSLGYWTRFAGDSAAARDLFAALLPVYERVFGSDHPETLNIRHNIAWAWDPWDPAGARDLYAALLPIEERVFGSEHEETLKSRVNLAYWTGKAGDPAGARDLLAEMLPVRERVLGSEHPAVLMTRLNLARWTGEAGDPAGARNMLAELLPVRERILGPEHPDTLSTRHHLARWTGKAGDPGGARDLLAELLPRRERALGSEHFEILKTRHEIARWTGEAGNSVRARDLLSAQLSVEERILGHEHPDTLRTRFNLARWTGEAGDSARARDILADLLPVEERVFGPEHPDTLRTCHEITRWSADSEVAD